MENDEEQNLSDQFYLVWIVFFYIIFATLLSYQFLITREPYFMKQLRKTTFAVPITGVNLMSQVGITATTAKLLANLVALVFVPPSKKISLKIVKIFIIILVASFVIHLTLALMDTSDWSNEFYYLLLITVALSNFAAGQIQSLLHYLETRLPAYRVSPIGLARDSGCIFTTIITILIMFIWRQAQLNATILFAIGFFLTLFSLVLAFCHKYNYYLSSETRTNKEEIKLKNKRKKKSSRKCKARKATKNKICSEHLVHGEDKTCQNESIASESSNDSSNFSAEHRLEIFRFKKHLLNIVQLMRVGWRELSEITIINAINTCVCPAMLARIVPLGHLPLPSSLFFPFGLLIFNIGSLIGNLTQSVFQIHFSTYIRVFFVITRIIFVLYFWHLNYDPFNTRNNDVLLHSDWFAIFGALKVGFTSGFLYKMSVAKIPCPIKYTNNGIRNIVISIFTIFGSLIGLCIARFILPIFAT